jgi:murein DD-endopeptidase MepM/ murein hydrolase activator NlpD
VCFCVFPQRKQSLEYGKAGFREMMMKHPTFLIATAVLTLMIVFLPPSNKAWLHRWEALVGSDIGTAATDEKKEETAPVANFKSRTSPASQNREPAPASQNRAGSLLQTMQKGKSLYVRLGDLASRLPIKAQVNIRDGKIIVTHDQTRFEMVHSIPVLNRNGLFEPLNPAPLIEGGEAWVPIAFLEQVLHQKVSVTGKNVILQENPSAIPATSGGRFVALPVRGMISYLSFLETPIRGAHVSTHESHLPGAPRTYRGGVHEGIDWYSYGTGVRIDRNTPVHSMADGVVVRADHDYRELTPQERNRLLVRGRKNDGQTPEYILDKLRGRSVWIQYDRGVMARYVHLDRITPNVKVGKRVKAGEIIGYVGNSGTSDGAKGTDEGLHLHLDILVYGEWFWKYYSMKERRMILEEVFNHR